MVDPVAAIKAKKAKILADAQREADALDADAREIERLQSLAEKYGLALVEKTQAAEPAEPDEEPEMNGVTVDLDGPAYRAAINVSENLIKAATAPLELDLLFDACVHAGVPLGGKRPRSTLSAYLSHPKSTLESIRHGVYWLKGVPVP